MNWITKILERSQIPLAHYPADHPDKGCLTEDTIQSYEVIGEANDILLDITSHFYRRCPDPGNDYSSYRDKQELLYLTDLAAIVYPALDQVYEAIYALGYMADEIVSLREQIISRLPKESKDDLPQLFVVHVMNLYQGAAA